ncbi:uncharacterized protein LOC141857886 [Brevipalpus obovatus]|uniref:uncharacterized protein LOC141857886 n=1 Tax=Brevipalpus obovatus TaxID=246614 RepID=UPI003D9E0982
MKQEILTIFFLTLCVRSIHGFVEDFHHEDDGNIQSHSDGLSFYQRSLLPNWTRSLVLPCFFKTCYDENDVGCFQPQAMELIPILPPVPVCPHSPHFIDLKFQVYLRKNTSKPVEIEDIPRGAKLGICTHGYTPTTNASFTQLMKETVFKIPGIDAVLMPDWDRGAKSGNYPGSLTVPVESGILAARNLQMVGRLVAVALARVAKARSLRFDHMYYYGHSYGAQMAHHVAYWLKKRFHKKIHRMTLADPGGPFFLGHPERAVNKGDADFVDCVHTSIFYPLMVPHTVGYYQNVCHRDFYPNGGGDLLRNQPGCEQSFLAWCSHFKALFDIDAAVGYCEYRTVKCPHLANFERQNCNDTGIKFGYRADEDPEEGIFYVRVPKNPYECLNYNETEEEEGTFIITDEPDWDKWDNVKGKKTNRNGTSTTIVTIGQNYTTESVSVIELTSERASTIDSIQNETVANLITITSSPKLTTSEPGVTLELSTRISPIQNKTVTNLVTASSTPKSTSSKSEVTLETSTRMRISPVPSVTTTESIQNKTVENMVTASSISNSTTPKPEATLETTTRTILGLNKTVTTIESIQNETMANSTKITATLNSTTPGSGVALETSTKMSVSLNETVTTIESIRNESTTLIASLENGTVKSSIQMTTIANETSENTTKIDIVQATDGENTSVTDTNASVRLENSTTTDSDIFL